ncbi:MULTISPECIES: DUF3631 domain-containing protein [unclassified Streptomyces]|uniref:DUF3631 domain-containing protein n=1 Tax=unclassified Streptomyces TaxID=2593676 RepID=UPI0036E4B593
MPTAAILEALLGLDDAPWADMSDDGQSTKPLTARALSKLLSQYVRPDNTPIRPRGIRVGSGTPKGYYAEDLTDAWERYCPPPPESRNIRHAATSQLTGGESVADTAPVADGSRHATLDVGTFPLHLAG